MSAPSTTGSPEHEGGAVTPAAPERTMVKQFLTVVAMLAAPLLLLLLARWARWIFDALFAFATLAFSLDGVRIARHGWRSRAWPRAFGTITRVGTPVAGIPGRGGPGPVATPLDFSYVVAGRTYAGTARFVLPFVHPDQAQGNAPGGTVLVYYDPADPSTYSVDPGAWADAAPRLVMALAFAAVAVWLWRLR